MLFRKFGFEIHLLLENVRMDVCVCVRVCVYFAYLLERISRSYFLQSTFALERWLHRLLKS